ncbi:MAG: DUF4433 domain-containing protein [Flavobacterium sp.]|nr:DUF4433 domain-containing protein [Flavobacterium sp.]
MIIVNKGDKNFNLSYAQHIIHYKNLESVLINGLLSHNLAYKQGLIKEDISMSEVQVRREKKKLKVNDNLTVGIHDLVSFYFNTKNPMLYKRRNMQHELVIILISIDILLNKITDSKFAIFTNGNAGSDSTEFFTGKNNLTNIDLELIFSGSWNNEDMGIKKENVRKMCSEILVYPSVTVKEIQKIACPNLTVYDYVTSLKAKLGNSVAHIAVEIQTGFFF